MAILQNKFVREDGSVVGSSVIISCKYTSDVNSQTNLTVGDVTADEVEVEIRTPAVSIKTGEKLTYYQIEDGVENLIGVFYAEAPTVATKTSIRFKAYDGKAKLATGFSAWLSEHQSSFPMTLRKLVEYACAASGLELAPDTFSFDSLEVPVFTYDGVTARQIVCWAAQISGAFVKCNADGEIYFDWYRETNKTVAKSQFMIDSLSKKDYQTDAISCVQFKLDSTDDGVKYPPTAVGNVFSIQRNGIASLLSDETILQIAQALYQKLSAVTYTPLSFRIARTSNIKAGDIVSVSDGANNRVTTYVMKVYTDAHGTQISSTGDQSYSGKAAVSSDKYSQMPEQLVTIRKTVDSLRTEVADEVKGLDSKIEQTAEHIMSEVAATYATTENLDSYVDEVTGELSSLQNQIDGAIETWFYNYLPTTSNFPASEWTTTEDKNKHLGDLFYIVNNKETGGQVYRWTLINGVYGWSVVEDNDLAKALQTAADAKDTADGKRRVFVAQPTPPYDVGDLWTDGTNLYVCKTARAAGSFVVGDFELATDYTTEETVKTIIEQTPKGVEITSYGKDGTLVTFIGNRETSTGDEGVWEAEYTSDGEVTSSLKFDFSRGKFVFKGDIESSKMTAPEIEGGNIIGATLGSDQGRVKSKMDKTGMQLFYVDEDGTSVPVGIYGNLANEGGGLGLPMLWLGDKSDPDRLGLLLKLYDNGIWLGTDQQRDSTGSFAPKENQDAGIFINNATGLVEIIRGLYSANTFEAVFS